MSLPMQRATQPRTRRRGARALAFAAVASMGVMGIMGVMGCARDKLARNGQVSQAQADQYVRDAVRQSSEGVVLDPSQKGLDQIERVRLGEIAQDLRGPAALCFLDRAIVTMERGAVDGEQAWLGVPEGQAKFRARVSVDGTVLTTDVLESGFDDAHMDTCLTEVISKQRFVESRDTFAYYIDVYYWVSLGFFAEANSDSFAELMRRQQAAAGVRAKTCLTGRVSPGEYHVAGLNLFDREGRSIVNRVERGELPADVSACIAAAFKQIRIHAEPDSFIRPAAPEVSFTVAGDGSVSIADERWLELIELEERAARDKRKSELLDEPIGADAADEADAYIDKGEPAPPADALPEPEIVRPTGEGPKPEPEPEPDPAPDPDADPGKPGTKLDLSPRRRN
jgi:hypothetical protein